MPIHAEAAAANNALWCEVVCRAHGRPGELSGSLWLNRAAVPPGYPNVVTLDRSPDPALEAIRALRDAPLPAGWGVKDSFGVLPLHEAGFRTLFEAEWICRPPELGLPDRAHPDLDWRRIESGEALLDWETAWGESRGGPRIFPPALVDRADIAIFGAFDGSLEPGNIVAGVIANRTGDVVGLSNLFGRGTEGGAIRAVSRAFPGLPLVGYESGDALAVSRALGFRSVGPLRVWVRTS